MKDNDIRSLFAKANTQPEARKDATPAMSSDQAARRPFCEISNCLEGFVSASTMCPKPWKKIKSRSSGHAPIIIKKGDFDDNPPIKNNKDVVIDLTEDDVVYPIDSIVPKLHTYDSITNECAELRTNIIADITEGGKLAATMCRRVPETVEGTVITVATLPAGQLRDRQISIESNINEFNAKAFEYILTDTEVLRRVGTDHKGNKNRYLTLNPKLTFGSAGPYARELEDTVKSKLIPEWEKLPGEFLFILYGQLV